MDCTKIRHLCKIIHELRPDIIIGVQGNIEGNIEKLLERIFDSLESVDKKAGFGY